MLAGIMGLAGGRYMGTRDGTMYYTLGMSEEEHQQNQAQFDAAGQQQQAAQPEPPPMPGTTYLPPWDEIKGGDGK